jgi:exonuclease SbcC
MKGTITMTDRGRKPERDNNNPKPRAVSLDVYRNLARQSQGRESSNVEQRSASVPPATDVSSQSSKSPDLSNHPSKDVSRDVSPEADQEKILRGTEAILAEFKGKKDSHIRKIIREQEQLSRQMFNIGNDRDWIKVQLDLGKGELRKWKKKYDEYRGFEASYDSIRKRAAEECRSLADQITQAQARQTKLQTRKENAKNLSSEKEALEKDLGEEKGKLRGLQQEKEALEKDLGEEKGKLRDLQQEKEALDAELERKNKVKEELKEKEDKLRDLQQKKEDLDARISEATKSREALKEELKEKEDKLRGLQQKKEDLDARISEAAEELDSLNKSKEKYELNLVYAKASNEYIMRLKDKIGQIKDEDGYNVLDEKIDIIIGTRKKTDEKTDEITEGLRDILTREKENTECKKDREMLRDERTLELKEAQHFLKKYTLGDEFTNNVREKIREAVATPIEKITDESYDDACNRRYSLIIEVNKTREEYEELRNKIVDDKDNECKEQAKRFVDLVLDRYSIEDKIVKLSESLIEYNKLKMEEIRRRISLPEESDVIQEINIRFECEVVQRNMRLLESAEVDLKDTNDKIQEANQKISRLERENKEILLSEENITKDKRKIERKIKDIGRKIGEKTKNRTKIENDIKNAQDEYDTQKNLVAELQEKIDDTSQGKDQAEIGNITQQIKEIDAHIAELNKNIVDVDNRGKETERAIDEIWQHISKKTNEIKQAEENVSIIESECAKNPKTIEELREEQQESKKEQEQASDEKERYAKLAQGVLDNLQSLRQQVKNFEHRITELSERFDQLRKREGEFQSAKIKTLEYSFAEYLRVSRATEESSGRKD